MTALASTDVTVSLTPIDQARLPGMTISFPSLTFGNGALTYPTGGVPLPAIGLLGDFKVAVRHGGILRQPITGYVHKYDQTNHKIVIYQGDYSESADGPLLECTTGYAPASMTITLMLVGQ